MATFLFNVATTFPNERYLILKNLAEVCCWDKVFLGLGHNKRMAKNIAAKDALDSKPTHFIFSVRFFAVSGTNQKLK